MDRREFLTDIAGKASMCATVLAGQASEVKGNTEALARELSAQIADINALFAARIQACEKANEELRNALQNATHEVFASCEAMRSRLNRLEMKNAIMIVWLSVLTIVTGTDFLTPFSDQIYTLI